MDIKKQDVGELKSPWGWYTTTIPPWEALYFRHCSWANPIPICQSNGGTLILDQAEHCFMPLPPFFLALKVLGFTAPKLALLTSGQQMIVVTIVLVCDYNCLILSDSLNAVWRKSHERKTWLSMGSFHLGVKWVHNNPEFRMYHLLFTC